MGHVICQGGLKPDPDKEQGIREMPTQTSKQDVKRLLYKNLHPNLSEVTAPRRELHEKGNQFYWDDQVRGLHSPVQVLRTAV